MTIKPTSSNAIKIELIDKQIEQEQKIIERSQSTLDRLDKAIDVYIDKEYVSRGLKERKKQKEERDELNLSINNASDKISELTLKKSELKLEQDKIEAEVGPIKYIAELIYGDEAKNYFDHAVRGVIMVLIFVFDPLAVLLLIAANISLRTWKNAEAEKKLKTKKRKMQNAKKIGKKKLLMRKERKDYEINKKFIKTFLVN